MSPTAVPVTLPLNPIKMIITPKNGTQVDYDKLRYVLENQLAAYFFNDPLLAASFLSVSLARNTTVRRVLLRTTLNIENRHLASVTVQYDGTATFTQQGAPSAQTLADQQNAALYSEPWSSALQIQYSNLGLTVSYNKSSPSSNNLSGGAIAGIVIGVLVGVAIVPFLLLFMILTNRKKKQKEQEKKRETNFSKRTRIIVEHNPPPPPPPHIRSHADDLTSDAAESIEDEESHGWRKYGFSSRQQRTTSLIKSEQSIISSRDLHQSDMDDEYSVSYNGNENVETTAGDEFLRRVEALGECSPTSKLDDDVDDDHTSAHVDTKKENPETDKPPDLSLFQMRDGYFAGTVNYLQQLMSFDTDDSHRVTVVSGSADARNEFPTEASHRTLALPPVVSEDEENVADNDSTQNEDDDEEDNYDQLKDKYGVLSPLTDPSYSPRNDSAKNTYVPPEALRERVKSAIADSASPTTQDRHNAMYQATAANALSDDGVSGTRLASDSRKNRLGTNTTKEIAINTGDAAELRKMRLQGSQEDVPKKVKGPVASKNLRKARLAQEHSSARVSKKKDKDLYAV